MLEPKPEVENTPLEGTVLQLALAPEELVEGVLLVEDEGVYVEVGTSVVVGTGVYVEVEGSSTIVLVVVGIEITGVTEEVDT